MVSKFVPDDPVLCIDPNKTWAGKDAFVVGGGSSLKDFDFRSLAGKNTIGVNDAFRLGPSIIKVCIFGDDTWFNRVKWELENFQGKVVSLALSMHKYKLPWMIKLGRCKEGVGDGKNLGWYCSTGASAICLACFLGASRVFMLGFDMKLNNTKSHWHQYRNRTTSEHAFLRHLRGMVRLGQEVSASFPNTKVINVTNESRIDAFPKMPMSELPGILACA